MNEIQKLKAKINSNIDKQAMLSIDINRGKFAQIEYEFLERENRKLNMKIAEMERVNEKKNSQ